MEKSVILNSLPLWNRKFGQILPISQELLEANYISWPKAQRLVIRFEDSILLLKQIGDSHFLHLPLLADYSEKTLKQAFLELENFTKSQTIKKLKFGGDDKHIFPGVPMVPLLKNWMDFFQKASDSVYDFQGDLRQIQKKSNLLKSSGAIVSPKTSHEKHSLLNFVLKEFPGRWYREILHDYENDNLEYYFSFIKNEEILGYVRLYGWNKNYWAPGVYFATPGSGTGGLGPIGIASSRRGQGLGKEILKSSWDLLENRGCNSVRIDWTTETDFYEKAGLQIVQEYQPAIR